MLTRRFGRMTIRTPRSTSHLGIPNPGSRFPPHTRPLGVSRILARRCLSTPRRRTPQTKAAHSRYSRVLHDDLVGGQGMGDAASNDNRNQPRCVKGPWTFPWTQHWYPSR